MGLIPFILVFTLAHCIGFNLDFFCQLYSIKNIVKSQKIQTSCAMCTSPDLEIVSVTTYIYCFQHVSRMRRFFWENKPSSCKEDVFFNIDFGVFSIHICDYIFSLVELYRYVLFLYDAENNTSLKAILANCTIRATSS